MSEDLKKTPKEAMERIAEEVMTGLRHGHFEITVMAEIIKGKKRRLILRAGKSHQFIINEEELG